MSNYNYLMKFILIGDSGVGKSTLLFQFIEDRFKAGIEPTIGIEFGTKIIEVGGKTVRLQIWDSAGQENYRSITRAYYRNTICTLLVYDVTSRKSFEDVKVWFDEARNFGNENMYFVLVGNKCELESNREVSASEGDKFSREHNMLFFETSAIQKINIDKAFSVVIEKILNDIKRGTIDPYNETNGIKVGLTNSKQNYLTSSNFGSRDKKSCC
jgi:Ras-related protein Rab-2A